MVWSNEMYLIGEKICVEGERDLGIVIRFDLIRGLIYVMFKCLCEEVYFYFEFIENEIL